MFKKLHIPRFHQHYRPTLALRIQLVFTESPMHCRIRLTVTMYNGRVTVNNMRRTTVWSYLGNRMHFPREQLNAGPCVVLCAERAMSGWCSMLCASVHCPVYSNTGCECAADVLHSTLVGPLRFVLTGSGVYPRFKKWGTNYGERK